MGIRPMPDGGYGVLVRIEGIVGEETCFWFI